MPDRRLRSIARSAAIATIALLTLAWLGTSLAAGPGRDDPPATPAPATASAHDAADAHAHAHAAPVGSVSERMAADELAVSVCVSSSLEPYGGAMDQLLASGAVQPAERLRRCLIETIFYHESDAVLAELASHLPHFERCYTRLAEARPGEKPAAVELVAGCLRDEKASS